MTKAGKEGGTWKPVLHLFSETLHGENPQVTAISGGGRPGHVNQPPRADVVLRCYSAKQGRERGDLEKEED